MIYTLIILFISAFLFGTSSIPFYAQTYAQEQLQTQEPTETEQVPVLTDKPVEIWTFIDDYRIITGKILHVTVQIVWKLGITVNLEDLDKIDLHPFKIEGVTTGERQIFDNDHDYIVITYTLSLPSDAKDGIYSIPSFSLSYKNEVDKTEGMSSSSPIAIQKTPILVGGKIDKDVITLGDRINYTLTIRHEKNVKLLWENIEKLNFSPFEILKRDIEKQTEGNIEKILINYTLSLYELGGKKKTPEIPSVSILYYTENTSQNKIADTATIETKEAQTIPIPIIINSLLKAVDVPLEGIKGPVYLSKKHVFWYGYLPMSFGAVLLLFLCGIIIRSTTKKLSYTIPKPVFETPQATLQRLKNSIASFQFAHEDAVNRKNIHDIDKALRTYLGILIGISNELAQSTTTSDFLSHDTQKQISEETSAIIQTVLRQLDTLIFGNHIEKEAVDKITQGVEEIIRLTGSKALGY
ncbi:MAG: hypothetical protein L3J17_08295 [Candidatus Jettenia sp.]|nr:MAG: hypothetical protein L3J17_08295 [Candidatus Jettenia sp.]